ncbi:hypothetical protein ACLKA7_013939 [Drosophila subpalustris]
MDVVDGLAAPLGQIATATTFAGLFGLLVLTALGFCHRHLWLFNVAAATGHRGNWQVGGSVSTFACSSLPCPSSYSNPR